MDLLGANNIRMQSTLEPMGALGDLGWYNVRFTLWSFDWALPQSVVCFVHRWSNFPRAAPQRPFSDTTAPDVAVPIHFSATLFYDDTASSAAGAAGAANATAPSPRVATFTCAFGAQLRMWAEVVGEKATLRLNDFVLADVPSCKFEIDKTPTFFQPASESVVVKPPSAATASAASAPSVAQQRTVLGVKMPVNADEQTFTQERTMIEFFGAMVSQHKSEKKTSTAGGGGATGGAAKENASLPWCRMSLLTQAVLDACMQSATREGARVPVIPPRLLQNVQPGL